MDSVAGSRTISPTAGLLDACVISVVRFACLVLIVVGSGLIAECGRYRPGPPQVSQLPRRIGDS